MTNLARIKRTAFKAHGEESHALNWAIAEIERLTKKAKYEANVFTVVLEERDRLRKALEWVVSLDKYQDNKNTDCCAGLSNAVRIARKALKGNES